jgi:hypothetical protein
MQDKVKMALAEATVKLNTGIVFVVISLNL